MGHGMPKELGTHGSDWRDPGGQSFDRIYYRIQFVNPEHDELSEDQIMGEMVNELMGSLGIEDTHDYLSDLELYGPDFWGHYDIVASENFQ